MTLKSMHHVQYMNACMLTHIYTGFCVDGDEPADSVTRDLGSQ